ncbi:41707_t:CDS:2, partial [Gigaspora margarita]
EEVEYKYNYRVFIKSKNRTSLLAKYYTAKVSIVDELLSKFHINIETLIRNKLVDPNDYRIVFKSKKATEASTQLVNTQDFKKFQADYQKYKSKNINIAFFITFIKSNLKQKINKLEPDNNSDNYIITNLKNKNSISKTSNLSLLELLLQKMF